ncbi:hypothetical protein GCM10017655_01320 [Pseudomonas turukhanskensis]|uniref:Uncharacterized protein n=1 Tax=Pseudomonas turukhanskensis TaxID=1806536 RepID=A0A9W6NDU7_9PSED|nr:hypothetical protein GCM10017655_01320 [Pseudomonas turukhanskensis]
MPASALPRLVIQVSVVKTGPFDPYGLNAQVTHLAWPDGLGWIRYFDAELPENYAISQMSVAMGPMAVQGSGYPGSAVRTFCHFGRDPRVRTLVDDRALGEGAVITLPSVKRSDFAGIGASGPGAISGSLAFHCVARAGTEVKVSFDAVFPLGKGLEGVGMPEANSDIGVQILLAGLPVQLGVNSQQLGWNFRRSSSYPQELDDTTVQGRFCIANCGTDASLADLNWIEGDGGTANNMAMETTVSFRYFQTTHQRPAPRSFSVPFTVTLDWQ